MHPLNLLLQLPPLFFQHLQTRIPLPQHIQLGRHLRIRRLDSPQMVRLSMQLLPDDRPILVFPFRRIPISTGGGESGGVGLSFGEFVQLGLELFDSLSALFSSFLERG